MEIPISRKKSSESTLDAVVAGALTNKCKLVIKPDAGSRSRLDYSSSTQLFSCII